jgi:glucosamine--fructose-6-phosphate aminotransferase (isomerizing)
LPYTRDVCFLNDSELAVIRRDSVELSDLDGRSKSPPRTQRVSWSAEMAELEGFSHFMLKETFEQPRAIRDTLRGRISGDDLVVLDAELQSPRKLSYVERVSLVACGTSLHAGLIGKFLIEKLARLPVDVDFASEFRYRSPVVSPETLVLGISQSGETADTLAAMREAQDKRACVLSICNVLGSMMTRLSDEVLYTRAGPEIGVASTKAFTTQLVCLYLLALHLGRLRGMLSKEQVRRSVRLLKSIPDQMESVLEQNPGIDTLAERFHTCSNFLYLGRGVHYPIALEGALKLKEISYIHAEGYPAGEMKHGPIALVDTDMPVFAVAPQDRVYKKTVANVEEIKAREGTVLAVVTEGDAEVSAKADCVIPIPRTDPMLSPLLAVVPLQLFAYHVARHRGCDVDKPRNLAKSVTVE